MGKNVQIEIEVFRRLCEYFSADDPPEELRDQIRGDLLDKLQRLQAHAEDSRKVQEERGKPE